MRRNSLLNITVLLLLSMQIVTSSEAEACESICYDPTPSMSKDDRIIWEMNNPSGTQYNRTEFWLNIKAPLEGVEHNILINSRLAYLSFNVLHFYPDGGSTSAPTSLFSDPSLPTFSYSNYSTQLTFLNPTEIYVTDLGVVNYFEYLIQSEHSVGEGSFPINNGRTTLSYVLDREIKNGKYIEFYEIQESHYNTVPRQQEPDYISHYFINTTIDINTGLLEYHGRDLYNLEKGHPNYYKLIRVTDNETTNQGALGDLMGLSLLLVGIIVPTSLYYKNRSRTYL